MDVTDAVAGSRQRVVGLADLVRVPKYRWRIVLSVTVAVVAVVIGYLVLAPATYTATSVVVARPVVTDPFTYPAGGADRAVNMTAENGIATSTDVIDQVAKVTGLTPDATLKALAVEIPTGGQVLRFVFQADSASKAVAGANSAAETYIKVRHSLYEDQRTALLKSYDDTIQEVTEQRTVVQKTLPATNASSPSTQATLDQVRALNDQLAQLAEQRAKIASADLSPGVVTSVARQPVPSSLDNAPIFLVASVLLGLLFGALVAYARESLDRRVRSVPEAIEVTGLRLLGIVRSDRGRKAASADGDVRYVALAVAEWIDLQPTKPVVVLSAGRDEGRTRVAGGLAVALAESGNNVYLGASNETADELQRIIHAAQKRLNPGGLRVPSQAPIWQARPRVNFVDADGVSEDHETTLNVSPVMDDSTIIIGSVGDGPTDHKSRSSLQVVEKPLNAERPELMDAEDPPIVESVRPGAVRIGPGSVQLGPFDRLPSDTVVVLDAPPAERDERGVYLAKYGAAVIVIAQDQTRNADLARLVDRVGAAGVQAIGFVLTGGRDV